MASLNGDLAGVLWRTVSIVKVTSGPDDRYNVSLPTEAAAVDVPAYFEVTSSEESAGTDRERREEALLVLWPDVDLENRDVVLVDGARWLVDGPPRRFEALYGGAPHHVEATLVRVREGP